jgi:acetoacetate decarboxylase
LRPTAWRSSSGELPVVEIIISGIVADLTLGRGRVVHDYLA